MKKKILIVMSILIAGAANAACPSGWTEIPMETATIESGSCPVGTEAYYTIGSQCNANILQ